MDNKFAWTELRNELDRALEDSQVVDLWLRDDDAIEASPALDRLLAETRDRNIPLTLAVIPASASSYLFERLKEEDHVEIAIHGWSHENHAPTHEKKQELGAHRPVAVTLSELQKGNDRLRLLAQKSDFPRSKILTMLVPPWNRIADEVLLAIEGEPFTAVSLYGRARELGALKQLNTHIDIVDWHHGKKAVPAGDLVQRFVEKLKRRRETKDREPIGILTHHLVHDEDAWNFLHLFFEATGAHASVRWRSASELMRA
ncbi:polysaccharide deacetylase family protein [Oryzifoliimicrobium ureilyticus]|uniref:polysaccharide deacetylase family protein n=1 Tax=Oryzifoliimicrobium ureilyticus TaxID=3113724 RepID=UPI0030762016